MIEKRYYTIREASEMLGEPASTLRYWEDVVEQLQPHVTAGHTRRYTPDDIALLRRIQYLRAQNVPVRDLSARLRTDERVLDKRAEARLLLQQIKQELMSLKDMI